MDTCNIYYLKLHVKFGFVAEGACVAEDAGD